MATTCDHWHQSKGEGAKQRRRGSLLYLRRGLHRIHYYSWLNSRRWIDIEEVRWLVCAALGLFFLLRFVPREKPIKLEQLKCHHCGGELKLSRVTFFNCRLLVEYCQSFFDSGCRGDGPPADSSYHSEARS